MEVNKSSTCLRSCRPHHRESPAGRRWRESGRWIADQDNARQQVRPSVQASLRQWDQSEVWRGTTLEAASLTSRCQWDLSPWWRLRGSLQLHRCSVLLQTSAVHHNSIVYVIYYISLFRHRQHIHTLWVTKTCHFISKYNFRVSFLNKCLYFLYMVPGVNTLYNLLN